MKIGFFPMLFLIFLVLKLTEVIDWSWWYVTMPLWVGLAIGLFLYFFVVILGVLSKPILWVAEFISRLFS